MNSRAAAIGIFSVALALIPGATARAQIAREGSGTARAAWDKMELKPFDATNWSKLGDWKNGERIAQEGRGKQYSDDPKGPVGGNCYACHQLAPQEVSYGTIGPSLYQFGKTRGYTDDMRKYAYGKLWNAEAYNACSLMPRFGHSKILTEAQVKDLVALLMDPESPVNK